jgi:hypothetical protein
MKHETSPGFLKDADVQYPVEFRKGVTTDRNTFSRMLRANLAPGASQVLTGIACSI